jgi:hypothetical protein
MVLAGTALERSVKTLLQTTRQRTRVVRRRKHEVPLRREHGNSIRSRHFGPLLVPSRLDALLEFLILLNFARK